MVIAKRLMVEIAGSGKAYEANMGPDTTFREILQEGGLTPGNYEALAPRGDRLIALDDKPERLGVGEKMMVSTRMDVGAWSS